MFDLSETCVYTVARIGGLGFDPHRIEATPTAEFLCQILNIFTITERIEYLHLNTSCCKKFVKNLSDAELISSLRSGQKQAVAVLYDRYAGLVYSIAYRILQNAQAAEDLTQDIFITFWEKDYFNPDRGSLSSFLGLLTRSRAIDKVRQRTTASSFLSRWQQTITEVSTTPSPLESATTQETQANIQEALQQLPELQRQILELNYYQDLSHNQIAESLGLTPGVVKSRLRQALLQLKTQIPNG